MPIKDLPAGIFWQAPLPEDRPAVSAAVAAAVTIKGDDLLKGRMMVFGRTLELAAGPPQWLRDPLGGKWWPSNENHWSTIDHFGGPFDIKNIWDTARFTWAPALAATARVNHSSKALETLNEWTQSFVCCNPYNSGPFWSCGQETSIRAIHLLLATCLLEQDRRPSVPLQDLLFAHGQRIEPTVFYAIGQMNNHAISESAGLFVIGEWLSSISLHDPAKAMKASKWARRGRELLERMVLNQIAEDGGHVQRSLCYQRSVLDTLSVVELLRRRWGADKFSQRFYERARAAADFLFEFVEPTSGRTSQIGAVDGSSGYDVAFLGIDDYRPSVQLAMALFHDALPYAEGPWDAGVLWFGIRAPRRIGARKSRIFSQSGYATVVSDDSWGVLVVPRYRIRASHADGLHLDVWYRNENWMPDASTRSYFLMDEDSIRMNGVWGHNTVGFDDDDQMRKYSRFMYVDWPNHVSLAFVPSPRGIAVEAAMTDWRRRRHVRRVEASSGNWTITDSASGNACRVTIRWRLRGGAWKRVSGTSWRCGRACLSLVSSGGTESLIVGEAAASVGYGDAGLQPIVMSSAALPAAFITRLEFDRGCMDAE